MGRKQVATEALEWLSTLEGVEVVGVLTDSQFKSSSTLTSALHLGLDVYTFETALEALKNGTLDYDLGVSILYWRKLKEEFLSVPKLGTINFHPSPLPDYKGTGGYNFAILDGHTEWGVSAHYVDEDIDTGGIIEVSRFPIDFEYETCQSLEKKSVNELGRLIKRVLDRALGSGQLLSVKANIGGRYITRREMEIAKKIRLGDDVDRKVRAFWFPPYIGAYMLFDGKPFTLVNRHILSDLALGGFVGTWCDWNGSEFSEVSEKAKKIVSSDCIEKKVKKYWSPPHDGAYVEIDGQRFTLIDEEILADLAPVGTTTVFSTKFAEFE